MTSTCMSLVSKPEEAAEREVWRVRTVETATAAAVAVMSCACDNARTAAVAAANLPEAKCAEGDRAAAGDMGIFSFSLLTLGFLVGGVAAPVMPRSASDLMLEVDVRVGAGGEPKPAGVLLAAAATVTAALERDLRTLSAGSGAVGREVLPVACRVPGSVLTTANSSNLMLSLMGGAWSRDGCGAARVRPCLIVVGLGMVISTTDCMTVAVAMMGRTAVLSTVERFLEGAMTTPRR